MNGFPSTRIKTVISLIFALVLIAGLGACGASGAPTTQSKRIVITMNASGYTPIEPSPSNPHPPTMLGKLAKEYEQLHPNVQINFLPAAQVKALFQPGALIARANAGDAPDISWAQMNQVNSGAIPAGLFTDLKPYLQKPNPYIKGNQHWIDVFDPSVIAQVTAPNGAIYVDAAEVIAVCFVYNKAVYQKANITPPTTFAELQANEQKLRQSGVIPTGFALDPASPNLAVGWWERVAMTSFFQDQLPEFNVSHATYGTLGLDFAVGIKKGLFRMSNPRYAEVWKLLRKWSANWEPNPTQYLTMPQSTGTDAGGTWLLTPLIQDKMGSALEATWAVPQLNKVGFSGKYGVFRFPPITKETSPYTTVSDVSSVLAGPTSYWQYYITTPKANRSMTPEKFNAALDWLMFISTPEHSQAIINEVGSTIPTMKGTQPLLPELRSLLPTPGAKQPVIIFGILDAILTPAAQTNGYKLATAYLTGQMSEEAFARSWDSMLVQQADAWAQSNHVDLNKYLS